MPTKRINKKTRNVSKKKVISSTRKTKKVAKRPKTKKKITKKPVKKQRQNPPPPKACLPVGRASARRRKKLTKKVTRKPAVKKPLKKNKKSGVAVKKVSKKRKISGKKTSKKTKKVFIAATEEQCFWINNGPVLKNLQDLHEALKSISKEQFIYHAHGNNNDFALWVEYVLLDEECAKALTKAKTQKTARKLTKEALKKYK